MADLKKIIITSGYFNPIHVGHINLMKEARKLGDFLVIIVNNDEQVKLKGSKPFMSEKERIEIVEALKYADKVVLSVDKDKTVAESLKLIATTHSGQFYFAKGGDRNSNNIPEQEKRVCEDFKIQVINNVGGNKVQSSSWLLKNTATI